MSSIKYEKIPTEIRERFKQSEIVNAWQKSPTRFMIETPDVYLTYNFHHGKWYVDMPELKTLRTYKIVVHPRGLPREAHTFTMEGYNKDEVRRALQLDSRFVNHTVRIKLVRAQ